MSTFYSWRDRADRADCNAAAPELVGLFFDQLRRGGYRAPFHALRHDSAGRPRAVARCDRPDHTARTATAQAGPVATITCTTTQALRAALRR